MPISLQWKIMVWDIHLRVGLYDPSGSFPTQAVLWFCDGVEWMSGKSALAGSLVWFLAVAKKFCVL